MSEPFQQIKMKDAAFGILLAMAFTSMVSTSTAHQESIHTRSERSEVSQNKTDHNLTLHRGHQVKDADRLVQYIIKKKSQTDDVTSVHGSAGNESWIQAHHLDKRDTASSSSEENKGKRGNNGQDSDSVDQETRGGTKIHEGNSELEPREDDSGSDLEKEVGGRFKDPAEVGPKTNTNWDSKNTRTGTLEDHEEGSDSAEYSKTGAALSKKSTGIAKYWDDAVENRANLAEYGAGAHGAAENGAEAVEDRSNKVKDGNLEVQERRTGAVEDGTNADEYGTYPNRDGTGAGTDGGYASENQADASVADVTSRVQDGHNTVEAGTNAVEAGTNAVEARTNGIGTRTNEVEGSTNTVEGGTNAVEAWTNRVGAGTNAVEGSTNTVEGGTNAIEGGTNAVRVGTYGDKGGTSTAEDGSNAAETGTDAVEDESSADENGTGADKLHGTNTVRGGNDAVDDGYTNEDGSDSEEYSTNSDEQPQHDSDYFVSDGDYTDSDEEEPTGDMAEEHVDTAENGANGIKDGTNCVKGGTLAVEDGTNAVEDGTNADEDGRHAVENVAGEDKGGTDAVNGGTNAFYDGDANEDVSDSDEYHTNADGPQSDSDKVSYGDYADSDEEEPVYHDVVEEEANAAEDGTWPTEVKANVTEENIDTMDGAVEEQASSPLGDFENTTGPELQVEPEQRVTLISERAGEQTTDIAADTSTGDGFITDQNNGAAKQKYGFRAFQLERNSVYNGRTDDLGTKTHGVENSENEKIFGNEEEGRIGDFRQPGAPSTDDVPQHGFHQKNFGAAHGTKAWVNGIEDGESDSAENDISDYEEEEQTDLENPSILENYVEAKDGFDGSKDEIRAGFDFNKDSEQYVTLPDCVRAHQKVDSPQFQSSDGSINGENNIIRVGSAQAAQDYPTINSRASENYYDPSEYDSEPELQMGVDTPKGENRGTSLFISDTAPDAYGSASDEALISQEDYSDWAKTFSNNENEGPDGVPQFNTATDEDNETLKWSSQADYEDDGQISLNRANEAYEFKQNLLANSPVERSNMDETYPDDQVGDASNDADGDKDEADAVDVSDESDEELVATGNDEN